MRLIDKDVLLEAIGEEYDDSDVEFMQGVYSQWKCDTDIIKSSPEVYEGPEIVRCKDCKYNEHGRCEKDNLLLQIVDCGGKPLFYVYGDWFCAYGKRR